MPGSDLSHVDGPPLAGLDGMIWTADIPAIGARRCPDRAAIVFADRGETTSYAQLEAYTNACAALLHEHGLRAGDRIAYLGRNNDLYYAVLFGAIRAGVVLVPVNWRLAPAEISYQLEDSGARLLLCDPDLAGAAAQAITPLGRELPLLLTETAGQHEGLRALLRRSAPTAPVPRERDQVVMQLYTSGTTGKPKGVLISHGALSIARHAELQAPELRHLEEGCRCLSAMPNFHVGGMSWVLMGLVRFGTVVITADPGPANMLKLLRQYEARHSFIVPTVIRAMVDELRGTGDAPPALSGIYYGAMPIGESLLQQTMETLKCPLVQFFGMTENTGAATLLPPEAHDPARPQLLRSVGRAYPGMSLEIRDPDRKPVRRGEHGEIWIRSPTVMRGYWRLPEKTREAVVDGWYATGDGGYLDGQGYLYLTDRIKDMIVSGGENVYPVEVEEALRQHPAVLDAAVVGVPDERWGESVGAVVELRPGATASADEIIAATRGRIATYKCPKVLHFGTLPRTASGKVQRGLVREKLRG